VQVVVGSNPAIPTNALIDVILPRTMSPGLCISQISGARLSATLDVSFVGPFLLDFLT
jgi:hypothetical protein